MEWCNSVTEHLKLVELRLHMFNSVGVFSETLNSVYLLLPGVKESAPFQSKASGSP